MHSHDALHFQEGVLDHVELDVLRGAFHEDIHGILEVGMYRANILRRAYKPSFRVLVFRAELELDTTLP